MLLFVFTMGLLILGVGIAGMAMPGRMTGMVARVEFTDGLRYLALVLRLAVAAVLYLVADETGFPVTMRVLAGFSAFSGVVVLFLSPATLQEWLEKVRVWPPGAMRGICSLAVALGLFLVIATVWR